MGAFLAIDLKSFYASVECAQRGLDPLDTNLVVADASRTEKTICLAVTPPLKQLAGLGGRARLFEAVEKVREANALRRMKAPNRTFTGQSYIKSELDRDPSLELSFLTAKPRMGLYMEYSGKIYTIYAKYISPDDIHVYSVDEVFIDAQPYLKIYGLTPKQLCEKLIHEVYDETGITATAGIGTNLYLAKIAMDIVAKRMPPDDKGVRIAELDEMEYRRQLWDHRPLKDFWRVGGGTQRKLAAMGIYTMGDIARCSIGGADERANEETLYKLFGVNAQLLIDHAWGYESCEMRDIKAYRAKASSLSNGQVLAEPYENESARVVIREMAAKLALQLSAKGLKAGMIAVGVGYDHENLNDPERMKTVGREVERDFYGRFVPKSAAGTYRFPKPTALSEEFDLAVRRIFDSVTNKNLLVRRMSVAAVEVADEHSPAMSVPEQIGMFDTGGTEECAGPALDEKRLSRQRAINEIQRRFGKNAIFTGLNLEKGATALERNKQIGGHKA
ncbi:MAG: DNA methylase [Clostridiales bacterium]|nr:DNA methylase [Clostridiales bacterium]